MSTPTPPYPGGYLPYATYYPPPSSTTATGSTSSGITVKTENLPISIPGGSGQPPAYSTAQAQAILAAYNQQRSTPTSATNASSALTHAAYRLPPTPGGNGSAGAQTPTPAPGTYPFSMGYPFPAMPHYASYLQQTYGYPGAGPSPHLQTPTTGISTPTYGYRRPAAGGNPGISGGGGNDDEGDEELYPGMDDADYSAQAQYQSQSKADLKYP